MIFKIIMYISQNFVLSFQAIQWENLGIDDHSCPQRGMTKWIIRGNNYFTLCDCMPGYLLYKSDEDQCYEPWKRGPCGEGEHLVPPLDEDEDATCEFNPCDDGQVKFENVCVELGTAGSCGTDNNHNVVVNSLTFELICTLTNEYVSLLDIHLRTNEDNKCPTKGTRRNLFNICDRSLSLTLARKRN